jgi:hypothetical protein
MDSATATAAALTATMTTETTSGADLAGCAERADVQRATAERPSAAVGGDG